MSDRNATIGAAPPGKITFAIGARENQKGRPATAGIRGRLSSETAGNVSNNHGSGAFAATDSYCASSIAHVSTSANSAGASQLALGEVSNDNSKLLTGDLCFKNLGYAVVSEANAMLFAGLGLMGLMARRRKAGQI